MKLGSVFASKISGEGDTNREWKLVEEEVPADEALPEWLLTGDAAGELAAAEAARAAWSKCSGDRQALEIDERRPPVLGDVRDREGEEVEDAVAAAVMDAEAAPAADEATAPALAEAEAEAELEPAEVDCMLLLLPDAFDSATAVACTGVVAAAAAAAAAAMFCACCGLTSEAGMLCSGTGLRPEALFACCELCICFIFAACLCCCMAALIGVHMPIFSRSA